MLTPAQIAAAKAKTMEVALVAAEAAGRHVFREQTDFVGRMHEAEMAIMEADDAGDNGELTADLRERRDEALADLAALCLARLALSAVPEIAA